MSLHSESQQNDSAIETFLGGFPSAQQGQVEQDSASIAQSNISDSHFDNQLSSLENMVGNLVQRMSEIELGQGSATTFVSQQQLRQQEQLRQQQYQRDFYGVGQRQPQTQQVAQQQQQLQQQQQVEQQRVLVQQQLFQVDDQNVLLPQQQQQQEQQRLQRAASSQRLMRTVTFDVDANMSGGSGTDHTTTDSSTVGSLGVPLMFGVQQSVPLSVQQHSQQPIAESGVGTSTGATYVPGLRPTLVPATIKIEKPSTFNGKHSDLENFLFQIEQYIDMTQLSGTNAVKFVVSLLRGDALTWWRMYVDSAGGM